MKRFIYLMSIVLIFTFTNCSKYEDGPWISLRGKENRLTNSWAYQLVTHNGVNVMEGLVSGAVNYKQSSIGFNDEGRFTEIFTIDEVATQKDGDWSFDEKKQLIVLTFDDETDSRSLSILKLKKHELWLAEIFGDNTIEYQLMPNP